MHAHRPGRTVASPLARAMAANAGLELSAVTGSGPHGRIMKRDIVAISARLSQPTTEPGSRWIPFSATRRTIAERMAASWREAPQVTLTTEADAEALARLRAQFQIDLPEVDDLSYTDLFIKIAAAALREQPQLNAQWRTAAYGVRRGPNPGLAVDAERGLVVPVIREADRRSGANRP